MPSFDYDEDFQFACRISQEAFQEVDLSGASQSRSSWDGNVINLKDDRGKGVLSFSSAQFGEYMRSKGRAGTSPRLDGKPLRRDLEPAMPLKVAYGLGGGNQLVSAAEARRMVHFITSLSLVLSLVITVASVAAFVVISFNGGFGLGLLTLIAGIFIAALSHFLTRLANIGLEVLADIASDLRAIRMSSQDRL